MTYEMWATLAGVVAGLTGLAVGYAWGYRDRSRHYK